MIEVRRRDTGAIALTRAEDSLAGLQLESADLPYASLGDFDLRDANPRGADLCNADLRGAQLVGATLIGADLTSSNCVRADFSRTSLGDARLQAINRATKGDAGTRFRRADCTRCTLKHSNLSASSFADATLHRADFTRSVLRNADFAGAELTGADLSFCDLRGASLAHASLVGAILAGCNLEGADLTGVDLTLASLNGVKCAGARFGGSLWSKTSLARATGLQLATGLDDLRLGDASSIDLWTLRAHASLPGDFLEHCGAPPEVVAALAPLHLPAARASA